MICDVQLADMRHAMSLISGVAKSRLQHDVVDNILIEADNQHLDLSATNLTVSMRTSIPVASCEPSKPVAVPARLLSQILQVADGPTIQIKSSDKSNRLSLIDGAGSKFQINTLITDNWPTIIHDVTGTEITHQASTLRDVVDWTVFATTDERSRYALNGVLFEIDGEICRWVATDGRRLSLIEKISAATDNKLQVLIPAQTMRDLRRALPDAGVVKMIIGDQRVRFDTDNATLTSTLLENRFPQYGPLIKSDYKHTISFDRQQLLHAVRCASLMQVRNPVVDLRIQPTGEITVIGKETETGFAESIVKADTGDITKVSITFNANYLIDMLQARLSEQHDTMTLNLVNGSETGYFIPTAVGIDNALHIVMPMTTRGNEDEVDDDDEDTDDDEETDA